MANVTIRYTHTRARLQRAARDCALWVWPDADSSHVLVGLAVVFDIALHYSIFDNVFWILHVLERVELAHVRLGEGSAVVY